MTRSVQAVDYDTLHAIPERAELDQVWPVARAVLSVASQWYRLAPRPGRYGSDDAPSGAGALARWCIVPPRAPTLAVCVCRRRPSSPLVLPRHVLVSIRWIRRPRGHGSLARPQAVAAAVVRDDQAGAVAEEAWRRRRDAGPRDVHPQGGGHVSRRRSAPCAWARSVSVPGRLRPQRWSSLRRPARPHPLPSPPPPPMTARARRCGAQPPFCGVSPQKAPRVSRPRMHCRPLKAQALTGARSQPLGPLMTT
jgi:hypothetical protein